MIKVDQGELIEASASLNAMDRSIGSRNLKAFFLTFNNMRVTTNWVWSFAVELAVRGFTTRCFCVHG